MSDLGSAVISKVGEDLPGLGLFFKAAKAISSVRDYYSMEKVIVFLNELSNLTTEQRKNLVAKINIDNIYGQKFGSFIVVALDREDFSMKSRYLARACKYYEYGVISRKALVVVKTVIENMHLSDIETWIGPVFRFPKPTDAAYSSFVANGLVKTEFNMQRVHSRGMRADWNLNDEVMKTKLTPLGYMFYKIVKDEDPALIDPESLSRCLTY